jgi:hypothetical protein
MNPGNFERISSKIATPRICDLWMINPKFPQGKAKTVCRGKVSSKYFPSLFGNLFVHSSDWSLTIIG